MKLVPTGGLTVALCILLALGVALGAPASARADAASGDDDTKSAALATALAIGGTAAGYGLIAAAFENDDRESPLRRASVPFLVTGGTLALFGPSLGNWYAHQGLSTGLALRLMGGLGIGIGASLFVQNLFSDGAGAVAGLGIGGTGVGLFAAGTVLDLWQAHRAVATYNRAHAGGRLAIAPAITRADGIARTGFAIVGTF